MVPRESPTPIYRWVCLGVLFLSGFMAFAIRLGPAVALPDLQITFGLTAAELSLLTALYLWPFAFMQPVAGVLTDRLGPRRSDNFFDHRGPRAAALGDGAGFRLSPPGTSVYGYRRLNTLCSGGKDY